MTVELFPRLDSFSANALWAEFASDEASIEFEDVRHPAVTFTATGGSRVDFEKLMAIRSDLLSIARDCGFPGERCGEMTRQFDFRVSRYLVESSGVPPCEAYRQGVWAYFTLVLLPDVTDWRYPGRKRERWTGGVRNTFGVLWRRGFLIGADHGDGRGSDWGSLEPLTQDALVQIVERPLLSASPRTARMIAAIWKKASEENRGGAMEAVTREAARNLIAYRVTQDLDGLSDQELSHRVGAVFRKAVAMISRAN
ncbi:hypothetical protein [Thioalkalivibrio sp. ALMg3]|uniref:hypothetical protein n=1 Tax=Thioalkalivibrio sp. ALMg3 TaxID=1158163 RepID=UPI0009D99AFA|nr:hypothetical protein [Thioalkalivibrio sp. ALMg3]